MIRIALIACLVTVVPLAAKILLITHSYNRPDFIELQAATFQRFLQDEYEFVVFNDAPEEAMSQAIQATCDRLGLRCIRIRQDLHSSGYLKRNPGEPIGPSIRAANVVTYSLRAFGFAHNDLVAMIDSDMFLTREFSIRQWMEGSDLLAVPQHRGHLKYMWIGIVFFDMPRIPNKWTLDFNCGLLEGVSVDTGGYSATYVRAHPKLRYQWVAPAYVQQALRDAKPQTPLARFLQGVHELQPEDEAVEFFLNYAFLHYRSGSNWNNRPAEFHARKSELLKQYLGAVLAGD